MGSARPPPAVIAAMASASLPKPDRHGVASALRHCSGCRVMAATVAGNAGLPLSQYLAGLSVGAVCSTSVIVSFIFPIVLSPFPHVCVHQPGHALQPDVDALHAKIRVVSSKKDCDQLGQRPPCTPGGWPRSKGCILGLGQTNGRRVCPLHSASALPSTLIESEPTCCGNADTVAEGFLGCGRHQLLDALGGSS